MANCPNAGIDTSVTNPGWHFLLPASDCGNGGILFRTPFFTASLFPLSCFLLLLLLQFVFLAAAAEHCFHGCLFTIALFRGGGGGGTQNITAGGWLLTLWPNRQAGRHSDHIEGLGR